MTSHTLAHPFDDDREQSSWLVALGVAVLVHTILLMAGMLNRSGDSLLDLINQGETLAIAPSDPNAAFEQKVFEIDLTPPPPPEANPEFVRPQEVVKKEPEAIKKPVPQPKPVDQPVAQPSAYAASGYEAGNKNFPKPPYPYEARAKRLQGTVVLALTISAGKVVSAEVTSSSGYGILDSSTITWIKRQWKFPENTTRNVIVPFRYELGAATAQ